MISRKARLLLVGAGLATALATLLPQTAQAWWAHAGGWHAGGGAWGVHAGGWHGTAWGHPGFGGVYHPPAFGAWHRPVPFYPGVYHPAAAFGAAALGTAAVIGTAAAVGAAAAASQPVVAYPAYGSAPVYAAPPPPTAAPLAIGQLLPGLPEGCYTQPLGTQTYYRCGNAWLRGFMQGSSVSYLVVPPPNQ